MAVVLIYGPPAAGKLTVARELAALTGFKLFDNHISIDWARDIYEFGDPRFLPFVENLRKVVFEEAARDGWGIIMTFAFTGWRSEPEGFGGAATFSSRRAARSASCTLRRLARCCWSAS